MAGLQIGHKWQQAMGIKGINHQLFGMTLL